MILQNSSFHDIVSSFCKCFLITSCLLLIGKRTRRFLTSQIYSFCAWCVHCLSTSRNKTWRSKRHRCIMKVFMMDHRSECLLSSLWSGGKIFSIWYSSLDLLYKAYMVVFYLVPPCNCLWFLLTFAKGWFGMYSLSNSPFLRGIVACSVQWMPFEEYAAQPFNQKHGLTKGIIDICLAKLHGDYAGFFPRATTSYFNNKSSYLYLNSRNLNNWSITSVITPRY